MTSIFRTTIATYNVLSSHLCSPSSLTGCKPEWLEEQTRYNGLLSKLEPMMQDQKAILCLQEVSSLWAGRLHSFFQQRGYYFVFSGYGGRFSGYMGCGIAFPSESFDLQTCSTPCISDTKKIWPQHKTPNLIQRVWNYLRKPFTKPDISDVSWDIAKRRFNTLVFLRLKEKLSNKVMCVGTYHMPCVYQYPQTMVIHAALAAQQMITLAKNDPFVFAGDFNFKPGEAPYRLVTEGTLSIEDAAHPKPLPKDTWSPTLSKPLRSAYAVVEGKEPDHTTWAKFKNESEFIDTLDYLFFGNGFKVDSVRPLPHRSATQGPYPNATEPSDHMLLSAVFTL